MSAMKYPDVVRAARSIGTEKKNLAEALFLAIPPRRGRPVAGTLTIDEQLAEAAAEIERETGETYSPDTLKTYRLVAAWVAAGNGPVHGAITWADASWTAHREAYDKGISWDAFVAGKRTKRAVREQAGASTGDVPAAARAINNQPDEATKLVEEMTPAARAAVGRALFEAEVARVDPDVTKMMRRRDSEDRAQEDADNHGAHRGLEHEALAILQIDWLHTYGHTERIERVIAHAQGLLEGHQAEHLTPEMFNE